MNPQIFLSTVLADATTADPTAVNIIRAVGIIAMVVGVAIIIRRMFRGR